MNETAQPVAPGGVEAGETGEAAPGRIVPNDSVFSPSVSVVLCTHGGAAGLAEAFEAVFEFLETVQTVGEIFIIGPRIEGLEEWAREQDVTLVPSENSDYGADIKRVLELVRGKYVVIGDVDGSYNFRQLPLLFKRIASGADLALGSRVRGVIEMGAMSPGKQWLALPVLSGFLNVFYGTGVSDPGSGFRVVRRSVLEEFTPTYTGRGVASEMTLDATIRGFRVDEAPVTYRQRGELGDADASGWDYLRFALGHVPGDLFTVPGVAMVLVGLLLTAGTALGLDTTVGGRQIYFGIRTMVAASLLVLVGQQTASLGAFTTATSDATRRTGDAVTSWLIDRLSLGRAVLSGVVVFSLGGAYAAFLVYSELVLRTTPQQGFADDLLAMTAILLGVQLVVAALVIGSRRSP